MRKGPEMDPMVPAPIIPAKAGIHEALIWIPAFAGMIGVGRMGKGSSLDRPQSKTVRRRRGRARDCRNKSGNDEGAIG